MPKFVEMLVVLPLVFAIFLGRNDYLHPVSLGLVDNRVGMVSAISQEILGIEVLYKERSLCAIRDGALCDKSSDRHAVRIHGQVYLGVKPPFVRSMA